MVNKICTSIEQSKKLIELGIDVNTADMFWDTFFAKKPEAQVDNHHFIDKIDKHRVPAWSLSALLKLIKSEFYGETIYGDTITYKVSFRKFKFTNNVDLYQIAYGSIKFEEDGQYSFKDMVNTGQTEDPIDAAFQMVVWLKENGKI